MAGRCGGDPRRNAAVMDVRLFYFVPREVRPYFRPRCSDKLGTHDADTASFRVPQDKMDTLHQLLHAALEARGISFSTSEHIAGKCMSMTVVTRPASLWTHAMFAALSKLEKSGVRQINLSRVELGDLNGEFRQWIGISSTSPQGPWQRAHHFTTALTVGATDASSAAWGRGEGGCTHYHPWP